MRVSNRLLSLAAISLVAPVISLGAQPAALAAMPARATTFVNWPGFLNGPAHSSYNGSAAAITTANAGSISHAWTWTPAPPTHKGQSAGLLASPTVVNGVVYIGANTGIFYALDAATGKVLWSRSLGYVLGTTCGPLGIVSTATVENAPNGGPLTVYVAGGDGYLYALNAATGAVVWKSVIAIPSKTVNDYYDWSSPTIANGNIYVGQASNCDAPLINGGLKEYSQATGALEHFYQTYPGHKVQPSIWSSAAVDVGGQTVFATTGNGPGGDAASMVRLNASTLARQDGWAVPKAEQTTDSDFGGSPTLFTANLGGTATAMVGACNKNGVYYAFKRADLAAGPVWRSAIGSPYNHNETECDAAAIWDGTHLFAAGNGEKINGTTFAGDLNMLNPVTGTPTWKLGLPGPPIGSPTMDGAGVIAVTEYGFGSASKALNLYLVDSATGAVLNKINIGPDFGQPVFADNKIFVPTQNHGLIVYSAPAGPVASFTASCTGLTCSFDASASSAPGGVTGYAWDFGDGSTGSGETISHPFTAAGSYQVKLTVTASGGQTASDTQQVTVSSGASPIAFVAGTHVDGNQPTETVTVPSSVTAGDALLLVATAALNQPFTAPARWILAGSNNSSGAMVTSVWSRVATAADAGSKVTVTFSSTFRRGDLQLLAYSGTSASSPVLSFASNAGQVTASAATTPTVSVTGAGDWVLSAWAAKSSAVNSWAAPGGQLVRDADYGTGSGRIDMIVTDPGAPAAAGTAGGLKATTDQPFTADTTWTLILAPAP